MKTKFTFLATVLICGLPVVVEAQNLFRTGRPNYARPTFNTPVQPRAVQGVWSRPVAPVRPVYGFPPSYATAQPPFTSDADYVRLQHAWENYRREALRYQRRNGDAVFSPTATWGPTIPPTRVYLPPQAGTHSGDSCDGGMCRTRCQPRYNVPTDVTPRNLTPADIRPSLVPVAPRSITPQTYWQNRPRIYDNSQYKARNPVTPNVSDLTRTASRPITDFMRWLTQ